MEAKFTTAILENDFRLECYDNREKTVKLYCKNVLVKKADTTDKVAKKIFVIDAVESGVSQTRLSDYLRISRQSIHTWMKAKKFFGYEGLIHSYNPDLSKNLKTQRRNHKNERVRGDKARLFSEKRKKERGETKTENVTLNSITEIQQQPYEKQHEWQATRYAGIFIYIITLIFQNRWIELVMGLFGVDWQIFMVFLLMAGKNIRSIEQLKNIRSKEAGVILGFGKLPAKPKIWEWFYNTAKQKKSNSLLLNYFRHQIATGLVSVHMWFIDGHLLPYTGKNKTHYGYNTQRRMPMHGQTNQVTCDIQGRIVDFVIEEGKGDLRSRIVEQTRKWEDEFEHLPVLVFDREGYEAKFFHQMQQEGRPFITWEKHIDKSELEKIPAEKYSKEIKFNEKVYRLFEGEKVFKYTQEADNSDANKKAHSVTFSLRRIHIWNEKTNKRTCGLAWDGKLSLSIEDCAKGILSRWGASENTFKHIQTRHPFHYHPGFKFVESERQEIKNPEIKTKEATIARIKKTLQKCYKKLSKAIQKVGTSTSDSKSNKAVENIKTLIDEQENELKIETEGKAKFPKKIDVSTLSDYSSYKRIDNEGKNIFDFCTASVWNARKTLVNWLREHWDQENELIDLFYAITYCQGWVKTTGDAVRVRLEPLEQPKRRAAQEQLCRKLTSLGARLPRGKKLIIEVGDNPTIS